MPCRVQSAWLALCQQACVCVCGAAVECGFTERNETGFFLSRLGNLFNLLF